MDLSGVDKNDAEELGWAVVEILSEAANMDAAGKLIATLVKGHRDAEKELSEGLIINPYWATMGFDSGYSKKTRSYLNGRAKKNFSASLFKWGGSAASVVTAVDVGTSSLGAQSLALTGAHAVKLVKLRNMYTNAEFRGYVDLCLQAKAVKGVFRGAETTMALIPGACIAATIGFAAANAVGKLGVKVTLHKAIDRTAQMIHFHAYLEQADSGAKPATELMKEIFCRRGVMRFHQYDVPALISEQAGWMALSDKLKLI